MVLYSATLLNLSKLARRLHAACERPMFEHDDVRDLHKRDKNCRL